MKNLEIAFKSNSNSNANTNSNSNSNANTNSNSNEPIWRNSHDVELLSSSSSLVLPLALFSPAVTELSIFFDPIGSVWVIVSLTLMVLLLLLLLLLLL